MLIIPQEELVKSINSFELPKYDEVPDVGLYLDQVVKYINSYLEGITQPITSSMVSNYVKRKIISNPVKKQYNREQILYLMLITLCKSVMSLEQIQMMFEIQKKSYDPEVAYNYFYLEFFNNLEYIFGMKEEVEYIGNDHTYEKMVFKNAIITVCHKIYMDHCFQLIKIESDTKQ